MGCMQGAPLYVQEQVPLCRTGSSPMEGIDLYGYAGAGLMAAASGEGGGSDMHGITADVQPAPQVLCV